MSFEWKNICIFDLNKNKLNRSKYIELINDSSGIVENGEVMAIMGNSGSGKSTLLNALFGNIHPRTLSKGKITFHGDLRENNAWKEAAGYVDRKCDVFEDLSVIETLRYTAKFRYSKNNFLKEKVISPEIKYNDYIEKKVENFLTELKLKNCNKSFLYNLSESERKKVMIGIELISDRQILFLDEPTSGLDALSALNTCKLLKKYAVENNAIIILTVNQPSSKIFEIFDKLILLSNGNTVYNGKITDVKDYIDEVGIEKREDITYPELLLNICDSKEKDYVYHDELNKKNIFQLIKDRITNYMNFSKVKFSLNLYHIYLLIHRLASVSYKKKCRFLKSMIFLILTNLLIYVAFCFFICSLPTFIDDYIPLLFLGELFQSINTYDDKIKALIPFIRLFFIKIYAFLNVYPVLLFTATKLVDHHSFMIREINMGTYSPASAYISYGVFYGFILSTMATFFLIPVYVLTKGFLDMVCVLYAFLVPLCVLPVGLYIGAVSKTKLKLFYKTLLYGIIMSTPHEFKFLFLTIGIEVFQENIIIMIYFLICFTQFLIPNYHLNSLATKLVLNNSIKELENIRSVIRVGTRLYRLKKFYKAEMIVLQITPKANIKALIFTIILIFTMGIVSLSRKYPVNIRLKLQKAFK